VVAEPGREIALHPATSQRGIWICIGRRWKSWMIAGFRHEDWEILPSNKNFMAPTATACA
jgi:hypothetical protein